MINYSHGPTIADNIHDVDGVWVSGVRLAVLVGLQHKRSLVIWDWRNAQVLFVCQPSLLFSDKAEALM